MSTFWSRAAHRWEGLDAADRFLWAGAAGIVLWPLVPALPHALGRGLGVALSLLVLGAPFVCAVLSVALAWRRPPEWCCRRCGFDLTRTEFDRCPECGVRRRVRRRRW